MTTKPQGLFEKIEPHICPDGVSNSWIIDLPKLEKICAEHDQLLTECEESNRAVARALGDVDYRGSYADGVLLLKQRLADAISRVQDLEHALYFVGMDLEQMGLNTDDIKKALGSDGIKAVEMREAETLLAKGEGV